MGNIFHEDFRDFIKALNNQDVEYILIGGYAVINQETKDRNSFANKISTT